MLMRGRRRIQRTVAAFLVASSGLLVAAVGAAPTASAEEPKALVSITLTGIEARAAATRRNGHPERPGDQHHRPAPLPAAGHLLAQPGSGRGRGRGAAGPGVGLERPVRRPGLHHLPGPLPAGRRPLPGPAEVGHVHPDRPGVRSRALPHRRHLPDGRTRPAERSGDRGPRPRLRAGAGRQAGQLAADDLDRHLELAAQPGGRWGARRRPPGRGGGAQGSAHRPAGRRRRRRRQLRRGPGSGGRAGDDEGRLPGARRRGGPRSGPRPDRGQQLAEPPGRPDGGPRRLPYALRLPRRGGAGPQQAETRPDGRGPGQRRGVHHPPAPAADPAGGRGCRPGHRHRAGGARPGGRSCSPTPRPGPGSRCSPPPGRPRSWSTRRRPSAAGPVPTRRTPRSTCSSGCSPTPGSRPAAHRRGRPAGRVRLITEPDQAKGDQVDVAAPWITRGTLDRPAARPTRSAGTRSSAIPTRPAPPS